MSHHGIHKSFCRGHISCEDCAPSEYFRIRFCFQNGLCVILNYKSTFCHGRREKPSTSKNVTGFGGGPHASFNAYLAFCYLTTTLSDAKISPTFVTLFKLKSIFQVYHVAAYDPTCGILNVVPWLAVPSSKCPSCKIHQPSFPRRCLP